MEPTILENNNCTTSCDEWSCDLQFPNEDLDGKPVNLCNLLCPCKEHQNHLQSRKNFPHHSRFRFPSIYNGKENEALLVSAIQSTAHQCGFQLPVAKSTRTVRGDRLASLTLKCHYGTPYAGEAKEVKDGVLVSQDGVKEQNMSDNDQLSIPHRFNKSSRKRPTDPQRTCPFQLVIFLHSDNCWYLSTGQRSKADPQRNFANHKHHLRLDPDLMQPLTYYSTKNEMKLAAAANRTEFMKIASECFDLVENNPSLQQYALDYMAQMKTYLVEEIQRRQQSKRRGRNDSGGNDTKSDIQGNSFNGVLSDRPAKKVYKGNTASN